MFLLLLSALPEWKYQTGRWENSLRGSCGGVLEWEVGHRV